MKKLLQKLTLGVATIIFTGVTVTNPAPGLFSTRFGTDFQTIIYGIITVLLGLSGLIALAYIIIGGYQIATAAGSEERATSGRKTLTNAIIGLVVILLSYIIITIVVNAAFGNFGTVLPSRNTTPNSGTLP